MIGPGMDRSVAAAYLSALIDGEGHVTKTSQGRAIVVSNTDDGIVAACLACCAALDLHARTRLASAGDATHKPVWTVRISGRETLIRANEVLHLQAAEKAARLREHVESYQYEPPCTAEELEQLYVEEELSVAELARKFGRSETSVWHWIRKFGIPERTRSQASRIAWARR